MITLESPHAGSSFMVLQYILMAYWSCSYIKVSQSRSRSQEQEGRKSHNVKLRWTITLVLYNIEPRSLRAAWGFRIWRTEWCDQWPLSLSHDQKWPCVHAFVGGRPFIRKQSCHSSLLKPWTFTQKLLGLQNQLPTNECYIRSPFPDFLRPLKNDISRATIRQAVKRGDAVSTRWRQEIRASKTDLATNIPGRSAGDESKLEWCSQSGQW